MIADKQIEFGERHFAPILFHGAAAEGVSCRAA
jgi:hypothetical protein